MTRPILEMTQADRMRAECRDERRPILRREIEDAKEAFKRRSAAAKAAVAKRWKKFRERKEREMADLKFPVNETPAETAEVLAAAIDRSGIRDELGEMLKGRIRGLAVTATDAQAFATKNLALNEKYAEALEAERNKNAAMNSSFQAFSNYAGLIMSAIIGNAFGPTTRPDPEKLALASEAAYRGAWALMVEQRIWGEAWKEIATKVPDLGKEIEDILAAALERCKDREEATMAKAKEDKGDGQ